MRRSLSFSVYYRGFHLEPLENEEKSLGQGRLICGKYADWTLLAPERNLNLNCNKIGAGIAQPVSRLATGWTVRGSNSCGGEIFRTCPDRL